MLIFPIHLLKISNPFYVDENSVLCVIQHLVLGPEQRQKYCQNSHRSKDWATVPVHRSLPFHFMKC